MDRSTRRALTAGLFLALLLSHLACSASTARSAIAASEPISVRVDRATGVSARDVPLVPATLAE